MHLEPSRVLEIPGGHGSDMFAGHTDRVEAIRFRPGGGATEHPRLQAASAIGRVEREDVDFRLSKSGLADGDHATSALAIGKDEPARTCTLPEGPGVEARERRNRVSVAGALFADGEEGKAALKHAVPARSGGHFAIAKAAEVRLEGGVGRDHDAKQPEAPRLAAALDLAHELPAGEGTDGNEQVEPAHALFLPRADDADATAVGIVLGDEDGGAGGGQPGCTEGERILASEKVVFEARERAPPEVVDGVGVIRLKRSRPEGHERMLLRDVRGKPQSDRANNIVVYVRAASGWCIRAALRSVPLRANEPIWEGRLTTAIRRNAPWLLAAAAALAGLALVLTAARPGEAQVGPPPQTFRSLPLSGAEEVPGVTTTAVGTFLWRVTDAGIETELVLDGTLFTMGHFHLGAKGTNGPVVAFLFGPIEGGQKAVHSTKLITAADLIGPLAGKKLDDLATEIRAGNIYVNVHSVDNPAGVLRGQVPADAVPATTPRPPATGTGGDVDRAWTFGLFELGLALLGAAAGTAALALARRRA